MTEVPSTVVFIPAQLRRSRNDRIAGTRRAARPTLPRRERARTPGTRSGPRSSAGQPPPMTICPVRTCLRVSERSACWTRWAIRSPQASVMFMCRGSAMVGMGVPRLRAIGPEPQAAATIASPARQAPRSPAASIPAFPTSIPRIRSVSRLTPSRPSSAIMRETARRGLIIPSSRQSSAPWMPGETQGAARSSAARSRISTSSPRRRSRFALRSRKASCASSSASMSPPLRTKSNGPISRSRLSQCSTAVRKNGSAASTLGTCSA